MKGLKLVWPVLAAGVWINFSEFVRNEIFFKSHWVNHYQGLNLSFPSAPFNAAVWVLWGFVFATVVFMLSSRFSLFQTTLISWLAGFLMMWLVTWNLAVLPLEIMIWAIPLSVLEAFVASVICKKIGSE